jgi:hypothetical protein
MTENNSNFGYLGEEYQLKLLYNIIHDQSFGDKIIPTIQTSYFEHINYRYLFNIVKGYYEKYTITPNTDNLSQILRSDVGNTIEKQLATAVLNAINTLKIRYESGEVKRDHQYIKDTVWKFIQRQEYGKILQLATQKHENGDLDSAMEIPDLFRQALLVSDNDDMGRNVLDIHDILFSTKRKDVIYFGIPAIDEIVGGLPKGKLAMAVAGQGVGKSSFLTFIANEAYLQGKNVLHIYFDENNEDDVQKLHLAKFAGIDTKEFVNPHYRQVILDRISDIENSGKLGKLVLKRFSSDGTTVPKIRNFIDKYQELHGIHFDLLVVDYIDEIECHKPIKDKYEGQAEVAKSLHSMLVDLNMAGWTATQGTKEANDERFLTFAHCGGSVGKLKKAQLVLAIGADQPQREGKRATFTLLKSNISACGHVFNDAYFDRALLRINIDNISSGMVPMEFLDEDRVYDPKKIVKLTSSDLKPIPKEDYTMVSSISLPQPQETEPIVLSTPEPPVIANKVENDVVDEVKSNEVKITKRKYVMPPDIEGGNDVFKTINSYDFDNI